MKKLTVILLCIIIAFDSFGYMFLYFQRSINIKNTSISKCKEKTGGKIEVIAYPKHPSAIENLDIKIIDEHELIYEGRMYDYFRTEEKNDTIYYYCIYDRKEDMFLKSFTSYVEDRMDENSKDLIVQEIRSLQIFQQALISSYTLDLIFQLYERFLLDTTYDLYSLVNDVPTPPPRKYLSFS